MPDPRDLGEGARRATWERHRLAQLATLQQRVAAAERGDDCSHWTRDRIKAVRIAIARHDKPNPPDEWTVGSFDGVQRRLRPASDPGGGRLRRLAPGEPYPDGMGLAPGTLVGEGEVVMVPAEADPEDPRGVTHNDFWRR